MIKLNAKELRTVEIPPRKFVTALPKNEIYIIVDNVLDTYNVGAIFRLADAVAARQVLLCGQTLTPPDTRIKKASISTWKWVNWEYSETPLKAISDIRQQVSDIRIIAVEQDKRSLNFQKADYTLPVALVVGNETYGVSRDVLNLADQIVELPMWGVNKSLNVMVSLGIVLYEVMKKIRP
jgi:tRNA G18 (ribose-2'-O)-methylase SpoU